jgi:arginine N-succinyltransferase
VQLAPLLPRFCGIYGNRSAILMRYEIRSARPEDEDQLLAVAQHLDTVNLPAVREEIRQILEHTHRSFNGEVKDLARRDYVFVLEDLQAKKIIGTSMIIAQLGRRDAPYIYVDVHDEERYSHTLDKHFSHRVLKIGYSFNGPTEIGGLILLPEYRLVPERLGQLISYVRFLYIHMHRAAFRDEILAELLPPLEADGTSHLWDALGRHFTGMTYAEADLLSKKNKEFIKGLWPEGAIYSTLLSRQAQDVIGKVGASTRGVEKMLRRIGFRYAERIDPFDGGPHFTAPTDEVTLVQRSFAARYEASAEGVIGKKAVLAIEREHASNFHAVLGQFTIGDPAEDAAARRVRIDAASALHLRLKPDDIVWVLPLD